MDSSPSTPSLNRDAQIPGDRPPGRQNFVEWHLTIVGSQYGKCFLLPFWQQDLRDGSQTLGKFVDPWSLRSAVKTSTPATHPGNCIALNKCLACLPGQINSCATYTVTAAMHMISVTHGSRKNSP